MIVSNTDIKELIAEIPEGHTHIRTTVTFQDGKSMTFQEATIANIVRAYVSIKTHPSLTRVVMKGEMIEKRKDGYAEWQLVEK